MHYIGNGINGGNIGDDKSMIYTTYENQPVEYSLYGQFITYDELKKAILKEYSNDNYSKTINVFIDIYQFLMTSLRFRKYTDPYSIAAAIINYAAHMRRYFRTVHNMYSNIVLIYSTNDSENNTKFIPDYNVYYNNRKKINHIMYDRIINNINLVKLLIPYIPDVFLKEGTVESSVIIHDIIQNRYMGLHPNLILSNSQLMYQLPQYSKSSIVIRKDLGFKPILNKTYTYNKNNCVEAYCYELSKYNVTEPINQQTISFIMSLRGIPKRSIKALSSIKSVLKMAKQIPLGCEHDPNVQYNIYANNKSKRPVISEDEFINRYKCIDLGYQYKLYKLLPESKELKYLDQLNDKESVQEINNYYFKNSPLNLEEL